MPPSFDPTRDGADHRPRSGAEPGAGDQVVGDLEPAAAWAQTDADRSPWSTSPRSRSRMRASRAIGSSVGAIGERAPPTLAQDRTALRTRFKLTGKVALVEVTGLGAEQTGSPRSSCRFDGGDRSRSCSTLPATSSPPRCSAARSGTSGYARRFGRRRTRRCGARPTSSSRDRDPRSSRAMLVGGKLVALVDDRSPARRRSRAETRVIAAKGCSASSALDSALTGALLSTSDGGDNIADIVAAVAGDKRGVIDERRAVAQAATRDRVRAASAAAQAVAATTAMPGDLEDLGGAPPVDVPLPDVAEIARLRAEVEQRRAEMTKSMMASRDTATSLTKQATEARAADRTDEASQLDRRADGERARMHALLGELSTLETELAELERVRKTIQDAPRSSPRANPHAPAAESEPPPRARPAPSVDERCTSSSAPVHQARRARPSRLRQQQLELGSCEQGLQRRRRARRAQAQHGLGAAEEEVMTRAWLLAVLVAATGCPDRKPPVRTYKVESRPAPVKSAHSRPRHSSHPHTHGSHPHGRDAHHHHPHPHPHLDGEDGHHHPH
ncbi:MAG: hypothetical protein WKG01_23620 [Kofleriaceae bacterium]